MNSENTILLGLDNDGKKLFSNDYQHILLLAPPSSGKGVCFVIPSLLTFQESTIVHDIKLENYMLTSGYRASIGHKILVWNPLGGKDKTHRYNPLDFINHNEKIIDDIQKIAYFLVKNDEAYDTDARNLFTSIVLYLCANTTKTKSFGEIARMLQGDLIQELSDGINKLKNIIHPIGYQNITAFLKKDRQEQNSVIQVLNHYLAPWNNPLIDYATSKSDFDIAEFKKSKITLYVGINPTDINRLQPVMQFFYSHVAERLMTTAQNLGHGKENGGVCLFIDEFYSIGKLKMFTSCMPYFRGYKIKLFLIATDFWKIEKIYGKADSQNIITNCVSKIAFSSNDYKTANKISQICLDRTKNIELLSWQEIINLPSDLQIILRNHEQPIISKKIFYYNDEKMKKKLIDPIAIS
ncbi:type IV secretory system conjugative DNA transfer family protein [Candidatus Tisiphia endosymbiont of Micropterix aruncella]|uniref:type IV secretory system conjugative DNA transfer family protein n=1 Tax=Candidatus Tisiphia endosymbiont of Micropterix aruncella TaxID=3066271 RepID=UPI003AA9DD6C